ncbi:hypothetical protein RHAL1_00291 [Beijerinckiaceae bacterium RH AL1]|nr:DMT family transporter [Beijerinckiaceae bacterium]VVB42619.1 hypothetical protein RHAL8_00278 [Beijerinckiaceae bacterium RH AL8]VVB42625.1 hypothetical protein RHCH11_RHCH11_00280 [Beijerinckiaceae bacterium RH CH11]VVC53410.1 hypothetical protein RHAL1_00291 [Beijerinckiaceae bacterium RH AL1]
MSPTALAIVLAALAGVAIATQQVFNGGLRHAIGSIWWAGLVSYLGGTAFMVATLLVTRAAVPAAASLRQVTAIQWTGGVLGGVYIILSLFALPRLGVALVLALVVVGQMAASLTFDQFGLFGVPRHSVSLVRVLGAFALVAGVVLIKVG